MSKKQANAYMAQPELIAAFLAKLAQLIALMEQQQRNQAEKGVDCD